MESEMLHFSPVVLKKTRTFPELLLHTAAPQMASTTPPPPLYDIRQYPNGQANVLKCTTGTEVQSGIVSRVLASGARQVGGRTGNIPPTHRNGVHVLPTGDHLPCGSLWRHQLHLGLGHLVIGDAPQWPGIILDLNGKKGWNSNKELGKIDRNWQQIL